MRPCRASRRTTRCAAGGRFVTLVRPFAPPPIRGTRVVVEEVSADGDRLAGLVRLADQGALTPRVAEVVPLDEVARLTS